MLTNNFRGTRFQIPLKPNFLVSFYWLKYSKYSTLKRQVSTCDVFMASANRKLANKVGYVPRSWSHTHTCLLRINLSFFYLRFLLTIQKLIIVITSGQTKVITLCFLILGRWSVSDVIWSRWAIESINQWLHNGFHCIEKSFVYSKNLKVKILMWK